MKKGLGAVTVVCAILMLVGFSQVAFGQLHRLMNPLVEGVMTHIGLLRHVGDVERTGDVTQTGNTTQTGDLALTGALTVNGAGAVVETRVLGPAALTATDLTNGTGSVSIQLVDGAGTAVAEQEVIVAWVSTTALGAPSTNNIADVTVSTGTTIQTVLADAHYAVLTDTNGVALLTLDYTADGTNFVQAAVGARVASAALAVTGND